MSSQKLLKICKLKQKNTLDSLTVVVVRRLAWRVAEIPLCCFLYIIGHKNIDSLKCIM